MFGYNWQNILLRRRSVLLEDKQKLMSYRALFVIQFKQPTLQSMKQKLMKLTWGKSIFLHSVPVVQESKEVVPICTPEGADCRATQLISAVLFEPSLYS